MKSIEIVSHCWSGNDAPVYHCLLKYQIDSLYLLSMFEDFCEDLKITLTVCHSLEDVRTCRVVQEGRKALLSTGVNLNSIELPPEQLFRRAIGRNQAALACESDVIWFTDCDHCFAGPVLLAAHAKCLEADTNYVHPMVIAIHERHEYGDQLIEDWDLKDLAFFGPDTQYVDKAMRPIGGLFVVKGDWARENGYLNGTGWVDAVKADHFKRCKCDVAFRKSIGPSTASDIQGVYRIRHSKCGRDRGRVDHGKKTQIQRPSSLPKDTD